MTALIKLLAALGSAAQSLFSYMAMRYQTEREDRIAKEVRDAKEKEELERAAFNSAVYNDPESAWMSRFGSRDARSAASAASAASSTAEEDSTASSGAKDTKVL